MKKRFNGLISVLMPAHNEGKHIFNNLEEAVKVFKKARCNFEIVLVDDGSSDNTLIEAKKAARKHREIIVVKNPDNNGKGNAIKKGFGYAKGDFVVFLDSDLDLHPEQLHTLFKIMRDKQAEVIIGSKRHPKSELNYPMMRKVISNIYAFILLILFRLPLKDTQTGLKIFKYEALERIFPMILCKRFAFDVEVLANAHRLGYKIVESPVKINFRRGIKWGRMGFKDLYFAGMDTLAIFYRMYILRYYDRFDFAENESERYSDIQSDVHRIGK